MVEEDLRDTACALPVSRIAATRVTNLRPHAETEFVVLERPSVLERIAADLGEFARGHQEAVTIIETKSDTCGICAVLTQCQYDTNSE